MGLQYFMYSGTVGNLQVTAGFIPRWFVRTGLFISSFHRDIALRRVFHTVDLYLGGGSNWNPTLDIFN